MSAAPRRHGLARPPASLVHRRAHVYTRTSVHTHTHTYVRTYGCLHFIFLYLHGYTPESPGLFTALGQHLKAVRSVFQSGRQSSTRTHTNPSKHLVHVGGDNLGHSDNRSPGCVGGGGYFFLVVFLSVVCLLAFADPRISLFVCFVCPLLALQTLGCRKDAAPGVNEAFSGILAQPLSFTEKGKLRGGISGFPHCEQTARAMETNTLWSKSGLKSQRSQSRQEKQKARQSKSYR